MIGPYSAYKTQEELEAHCEELRKQDAQELQELKDKYKGKLDPQGWKEYQKEFGELMDKQMKKWQDKGSEYANVEYGSIES